MNNEISIKNYELIKFKDGDFSLDVNVSPSEETVWLTVEQISALFSRERTVILKHIRNIYAENELLEDSTCAFFAKVQIEGDRRIARKIKIYNLDVVISVGYRVKSKRGIIFRQWASSVLKQYLLNGQAINETRCLAHSDNLIKMNNKINIINEKVDTLELRLDSIISTSYFNDKIFYNGDLFEGYSFIKNLFNKANNRIIIIDAYLDYSVLEMLNELNTDITIYINSSSPITNREISLFQQNHNLNVVRTNLYHDRFIIIDDELYNIGSSIKDIGKKISHISKLESININELLNRYG